MHARYLWAEPSCSAAVVTFKKDTAPALIIMGISCDRILGFIARFFVFVFYFSFSLTLLFWNTNGEFKDKLCRIQHTYHQVSIHI